jgi:hypothetical protein
MEQYRKLKLFKCGKQGYTGVLEDKEKKSVVFKVSKKIDFNTEHEYAVLSRLNDLAFCPNFTKVFNLIEQQVEPVVPKNTSPFIVTSKYPILKKVILEEFVPGQKLYHHITQGTVKTEVIYNVIKQTLCAIATGQSLANLTHYDLHSDNVMLTPCDSNIVYLYTFNDELAFAVPTHGYTSKIIDFGFSFIDKLRGKYLNTTMGHTDIGFVSDRFDWVADPKLFLISIKDELEKNRKGTKVFSNIVKNLFSGLTVDWECGWDDFGGKSAADALNKELEKKCKVNNTKVFERYITYAVDMLCNLIVLPFEQKSYEDLFISYSAFVKEFTKIEEHISSSQYNLFILKSIVDSARKHKELYLEDKENGINAFRKDVNHAILSVSKFCSPRGIHFEKMLVSLYTFASCAEGYFHHFMKKKMSQKYEEYENIPVKGILDIIQILNVNLEDNYIYSEDTRLIVVDTNQNLQKEIDLNEDVIEVVNAAPKELKGLLLYNYYVNYDQRNDEEDDEQNELSGDDYEDEDYEAEDEDYEAEENDEDYEEDEAEEKDEEDEAEEDEDGAMKVQEEGLETIEEEDTDTEM